MAAGYGEELLGRVSVLVAECTRRVSRATRRILRRQRRRKQHGQTTSSSSTAAAAGSVVAAALCARGAAIDKGRASAASEALWSRRILMGERCQPLDFAGAIHYDSFGRRLARPPMPRSVSSLSCRSSSSSSSGRRSTADASDANCPPENDDVDVDSSSSS